MNLRQTGEFERRNATDILPHSVQRSTVDTLAGAPLPGEGRGDLRSVEERQPTEPDVLWRLLPELSITPKQAQRARLVCFERSDAAHAAFDILRTNMQHEMKQNGWRTIGIVSPTAGCGSSLVALNLAFSFQHQEDRRTVLLDLNLGRPSLAAALAITETRPIGDFLKGRYQAESVLTRYKRNLALGLNLQPIEYAAELLQSSVAVGSLARTRERFMPDIVLYDLPPMLVGDAATAFLPNVDCALIVARAEKSRMDEIDACERQVADKTNVLGIVLNDCQYPADKFGY